MRTRRELAEEQIRLQLEVNASSNINIVNCGNCGTVLLHDRNNTEIQCAGCGETMDVSDCPDLWYEGCENSVEFDEDDEFDTDEVIPTITLEDVVEVAMSLKLNPSISEIIEVLERFPSECEDDPTATWNLVVENLLYNCVAPNK